MTIDDNFHNSDNCFAILTIEKTILKTCDNWDTDYNSDNWEPEFMTIFVTWQLIVTLDSIRNSCDVFFNLYLHKDIDCLYSYCICKLWGLVIFAFSPSCICTFPKLYVFQFVFVFKFFSPSCIYIPPPKLYYAFTNMLSKVKELGANTFLWSFAQSVALIAISGSSPITSAK